MHPQQRGGLPGSTAGEFLEPEAGNFHRRWTQMNADKNRGIFADGSGKRPGDPPDGVIMRRSAETPLRRISMRGGTLWAGFGPQHQKGEYHGDAERQDEQERIHYANNNTIRTKAKEMLRIGYGIVTIGWQSPEHAGRLAEFGYLKRFLGGIGRQITAVPWCRGGCGPVTRFSRPDGSPAGSKDMPGNL